MLRRIILLGILLFVTLGVAGCGPKLTQLTADNDGQTVKVRVGDQIVIALEGTPSTGYSWQATDIDASMLQQAGDIQFRSNNPGTIGAGGVFTLTFDVIGSGTSTLTLGYRRSWETDVAPVEEFSIAVVAR